MDISDILRKEESEYLDIKEKYHSNKIKLLHDILCLSNSYHDKDRYLIFGVRNNKTIAGIEKDPNRKTSADIQDILRQSNLNRLPTVSLTKYPIDKYDVDLLTIKNRHDKPFFLLKDKTFQGVTIRNGVIYTRHGDTNTPLKESAPEADTEMMWKERFGLYLPPLELAQRLLEEPTEWKKIEGDKYFYHCLRPEFVIRDGDVLVSDFKEPWSETFPDPSAESFEVCVFYLTTLLLKVAFVHCDGFRYRIPLPKRSGNHFTINSNSIEWKIAQIYTQYFPLPDTLESHKIQLL